VTDLRSALAWSWPYSLFRSLVGGKHGLIVLLREHIKPQAGMRILDMGCGPAAILDVLPPVSYVGFDSNADYIRNAKQKHSDRGRFLLRTVGRDSFNDLRDFDIVLAIGLVHHLDDREALEVVRTGKAALKAGGRLIIFDGCFVEGQTRFARYLLKKDRGHFVRNEEAYLRLVRQVFPNVQSTVRHDLLNISYTHIIMECTA
jgi:SAM-dependent methyltransferase